MIRAELAIKGSVFPLYIDDADVLEARGGDLDSSVAGAESAAMWFSADRVTVVEKDVSPQGMSGAQSDGSPVADGTFMAQIDSDTWYLMVQTGEVDGFQFYVRADQANHIRSLSADKAIDEGYAEHIAEMRAREALDANDYAAMAVALKMAWQNAIDGSRKNRDENVRDLLKSIAGSYSATLAKVEALLEAMPPQF